MLSLKRIFKKYFNRNKKYLFSENIIHEMNGVVLNRTNNQIYDFYSNMIEEVVFYCKNQGLTKIDKIVFTSYYDTDMHSCPKTNISMRGDSKIKIIKEENKIIAVVCICDYVSIIEERYDK